jgi:hypothetical protein
MTREAFVMGPAAPDYLTARCLEADKTKTPLLEFRMLLIPRVKLSSGEVTEHWFALIQKDNPCF